MDNELWSILELRRFWREGDAPVMVLRLTRDVRVFLTLLGVRFTDTPASIWSFIIVLFGFLINNSKSENFFISEIGKIFREGEINNETSYFYNRNLPVLSKLLSINSAYDKLKSEADKINLNQFILFNIDDKEVFKSDYNAPVPSLHKQPLNQTTVNYCDFDPNLISSKRQVTPTKLTSGNVKQNVDIIVKGRLFNKSSEISGKNLIIMGNSI